MAKAWSRTASDFNIKSTRHIQGRAFLGAEPDGEIQCRAPLGAELDLPVH